MHSSKYNIIQILTSVLISVLLISIVDSSSVFSYIYTIVLFSIVNYFLDSKYRIENFLYFHFYLVLCIAIYLIQLYNLPNYMGLTGPEGGIGTDDVRFFAQITSGNISYLPSVIWYENHPFSTFLSILYPFPIKTPLNILIPNLLGISFVPYFAYKFSFALLEKENVSSLAKRLISFCPFTMANGLILMRDIWVVTFVISGLYFFMQKKYYIVLLIVFLISFIRFGSLLFLFAGILLLYKKKINELKISISKSNLIYGLIIILAIVIFIIIFPLLVSLSDGKLETSIFRESFITNILPTFDADAFIIKLSLLPIFLRIPLLSIFFFFSPFLKFEIYTLNVFNIRSIMSTTLTPIFLFCCWKNIIKSLIYSIYNKSNIHFVSLISIIFSVCLGVFSLQGRHKTILMPVLYILTAYGFYLPKKKYNIISSIILFAIISIQILFFIRE